MQGDTRPSWMRDDTSERGFWRIAAAVAAGILIAGAIGAAIRMAFVYAAVQEFKSITESIGRQSAEQVRHAQEQAERQHAQRLAMAAAQARATADQARATEEAKRMQLALAQAKEDAWVRYYRKPARCENPEGQAFVDCANDYIRAKRRFEELYSAGKV